MKSHVWEIVIMGEASNRVGLFSSKKNAIETLHDFSDNVSDPYDIREDTEKMNKINGPESIHLDYKNGNTVFIFVHQICFNNGANLIFIGRG
jgi:hypothetical protein